MIRNCSHAPCWYSSNPLELELQISNLMNEAGVELIERPDVFPNFHGKSLAAIIVPYLYSYF